MHRLPKLGGTISKVSLYYLYPRTYLEPLRNLYHTDSEWTTEEKVGPHLS